MGQGGANAPAANALVARHGGRYLARTADPERLEGEAAWAALRLIIAWPSEEAAEALINGPEYAAHLQAQTDGPESHHFLINGVDDFA